MAVFVGKHPGARKRHGKIVIKTVRSEQKEKVNKLRFRL